MDEVQKPSNPDSVPNLGFISDLGFSCICLFLIVIQRFKQTYGAFTDGSLQQY
jgi:hypothetical protein